MPFPDLSGWYAEQQANTAALSGQPPQNVIDAMQGRYDPSIHRWDPQTMTLTGPEGDYYFGGDSYDPNVANPANGTNVVIDGTTQNFAEGVTPYTFLGGGSAATVAEGSPEYHDLRDDARTRNEQGIARVAALVGGGAALANTAWGQAGAGGEAGGAAAADGLTPITTGASYLPGGVPAGAFSATGAIPGMAALPAGIATPGAVNALTGVTGAAAGTFADKWLPTITGGVNALLGANAADSAADKEEEALQRAIEEQKRQFDLTRADWQPWMDTGRDALNQLSDPGKYFTASPDYEFVRGEGTRGVENWFSARGGAQSGNALKALADYNANLASGEFGNWNNRQLSRAGLGTTGTNAVTNVGTNTANNTSNFLTGQGVSRASGVYGRNAALAQGINGIVTNHLYRRRAA